MSVEFAVEPKLSAKEFQTVLVALTLAERRPAQDLERLERMLCYADVIVTARDAGRLVGVARAVTDFSYCCYLSDWAVDERYQRKGIGKRLVDETIRVAGGDDVSLILVAAPAAEGYYPKIGMKRLPSCWSIPRRQ